MPISAPTDIAGCKVWIAADEESGFVDGDPVGVALNQGTHAENPIASGSARPTFKANILNGKPVYRFDGTDDLLRFTLNDPLYNGASTLYAVVILRATPSDYDPVYISGAAVTGQRLCLKTSSATWGTYVAASGDTNASNTLVDGSTYLLGIVGSGSPTGSFRLNGVADGSWSGGEMGGSAVGNTSFIGAEPGPGRFAQFDLAALVLYDTALSNTDRDDLEAYLTARYLTAPSSFIDNSRHYLHHILGVAL